MQPPKALTPASGLFYALISAHPPRRLTSARAFDIFSPHPLRYSSALLDIQMEGFFQSI